MKILYGIVAGCVAMAPPVTAEETGNPWDRDFSLAGDSDLRAARRVCAAGMMNEAVNSTRAEGLPASEPHEICLGALKETAKRGALTNLYVSLEPDAPAQEWQNIAHAALANVDQYTNARGETKTLHCTLAFDAGYVEGVNNPSQWQLAIDRDSLTETIAACFLGKKTQSLHAFAAGAYQAQIK